MQRIFATRHAYPVLPKLAFDIRIVFGKTLPGTNDVRAGKSLIGNETPNGIKPCQLSKVVGSRELPTLRTPVLTTHWPIDSPN